MIGIFGAIMALVKLDIVDMPANANGWHIWGLSLLCGIGFTMSLFISALAFGEGALAIRYREKTSHGTWRGGPMSYIMMGLGPKWTWLAIAFCIGTLISALVTGNGIQANAVADGLNELFGFERWLGGLIVAVAVFVVWHLWRVRRDAALA